MTCEKYPNYVVYDMRNFSDDKLSDFFMNQASKIADLYIGAPMAIAGVLVNLAFLFTLARVPSMRTITNCYLGSLALADMSFIGLGTLNSGLHRVYFGFVTGAWYFELWQCRVAVALVNWPRYASLLIVTLVVFERYIGICHPMKSLMISTWSRTFKLNLGAWIVAFLPVIVQIIGKNHKYRYCLLWPERHAHQTLLLRFCSSVIDNPNRKMLLIYITGLIEVVPFQTVLIINLGLYYKIIAALGRRATDGPQGSKSDQMGDIKRQVARMLIINGTIFFLSGLPWSINSLFRIVELHGYTLIFSDRARVTWTKIGIACVHFNSAINPVIYGITNPRYRQAFKKAFGFANGNALQDKKTLVSAVPSSKSTGV